MYDIASPIEFVNRTYVNNLSSYSLETTQCGLNFECHLFLHHMGEIEHKWWMMHYVLYMLIIIIIIEIILQIYFKVGRVVHCFLNTVIFF